MDIKDILIKLQTKGLSPDEAKRELLGLQEREDPQRRNSSVSDKQKAIAIIGVSGRYPEADNLQEYWRNLKDERDSVKEIPSSRWDVTKYFDPRPTQPDKMYCKWLGILEEADHFDPLFFHISPAEAELMDPQHRLFLQEGYKAIEDAGYSSSRMSGRKCGIYLGIMNNEYGELVRRKKGMRTNITGNSYAIAAARLSYFLNIKGPAIAVDTACSSSLVAIHLACQALWNGEIEMALAGGVSLYLSPDTYIDMCAAGMLSPDGRCKTFDNEANGFVPGEGAGAVVLKRLEDAIESRDTIYGVILGSGINQDGKTNGITAPSVSSQIALEREVYESFSIHPDSISYVEMHGTGTKLGDPIELEALTTVFREHTARKQYCSIGSVKTNIGHTSAAAGVASVHKVLLSMKHKHLPASLNFKKENDHFNWAESPFYVQRNFSSWETADGRPRRAAVSSFGFSGTNAHLVIEEYIPAKDVQCPERRADNGLGRIFVLSGKHEERLRAYAERLLNELIADPDKHLMDVAYTLQTGRDEMEHRLAIVARSMESLIEALQHYVNGLPNPHLFTGSIVDKVEDASLYESSDLIQEEQWERLAELWVNGLKVDWSVHYKEFEPYRISLPSYPFAQIPCRVQTQQDSGAIDGRESADKDKRIPSYLHALVQRNTSSLREHRYSSFFTGNEPVFTDHLYRGTPILSGAAQLEMARAAFAMSATIANGSSEQIRLSRVNWTVPISVVTQPLELHIRLMNEQAGSTAFEIYSLGNEDDGHPLIHCRGEAVAAVRLEQEVLDLNELKHRYRDNIMEGNSFYKLTEERGFRYGPTHRCLQRIYLGNEEGLAFLSISELGETLKDGELHPALLDSALQAAFGVLAADDDKLEHVHQVMPSSLGELIIYGACSDHMWVWVRAASEEEGVPSRFSFNLDICNEQGRVLLKVLNFSLQTNSMVNRIESNRRDRRGHSIEVTNHTETTIGDLLLSPVWDSVQLTDRLPVQDRHERVLIFGGCPERRDELRAFFSRSQVAYIPTDASIEDIHGELAGQDDITHTIWLQNPSAQTSKPGADWEHHVLSGFRCIKALLQLGYGKSEMKLTLCTEQSLSIAPEDISHPAYGGWYGLLGTLAKEYPAWKVRMADTERGAAWPLADILALPFDSTHLPWAHRGGIWYRQKLLPVQPMAFEGSLYKQNGVYVVIGGAGGLGYVWSEYMVKTYQARVIWIGRRKLDASIQKLIDEISRLGPAPAYMSADAGNREEMQGVLNQVKQRYALVNGVVHSAFVLSDHSFSNMTEQSFLDGYRAKANTSIEMAKVFGAEPLDFMLFFSSVNSFMHTPGQSNYNAGCTFQDAFARNISQQYPFPVKVVNWGYWGTVGAVASEYYRQRMEKAGWGSIEPSQAMRDLELLLLSPLDQLVVIKAAKPLLLPGYEPDEILSIESEDESKAFSFWTSRLRCIVADLLNVPVDAIDSDMEWSELSMDPVQLAQFNKAIYEETGIKLPGGAYLEYPALTNLAEAVAAKHNGSEMARDASDSFISGDDKTSPRTYRVNRERISRKVMEVSLASAHSMDPDWENDIRKDSDMDKETYIAHRIITQLSLTLKVDSSFIEEGIPFSDYGVDSITGVQVVQALNRDLGIRLDTTDIFDHSSVLSLTKFINDRFGESLYRPAALELDQDNPTEAQVLSIQPDAHVIRPVIKEPIAIIGMSGRFAKSENVDAFWEHLANGDDLVSEVTRWNLADTHSGKEAFCRDGSLLDTIDHFDPLFFNISAIEATYMDPQQRIFLEEAWKSLEDAGYAGEGIQDYTCGIYVGCGNGDYEDLFDGDLPPQSFWGNESSIIPARIAYYLNLRGPAVAVNTACSSSLVAIHLACQALWTQEIGVALAGGVFVQSTPWFYENSERAGMLSTKGKCYTFDAQADGFVPGEGAGVVMLKRLQEALDDGDHIYGVIQGSALNQDGTTNGITAPSALSQERLIREVCDNFNIDPGAIQMVEAHGTGTALGDPIEFTALSRAYRHYTDKKQYCAIGSVKTNIGHTATVAGIASLLKILLSLKHKQIPKSLHFSKENPRISMADSPFYVPSTLREWTVEGSSLRRAAVSSFGFSGTNAHMVIGEAPMNQVVPERRNETAHLIALSARTPEQLKEQAQRLLSFCEEHAALDCHGISGTLLLGRKHLSHRLACVVKDQAELQSSLKKWIDDGQCEQVYSSGDYKEPLKDTASKKIRCNQYMQECDGLEGIHETMNHLKMVGEVYAQGAELNFRPLFEKRGYRKVPLPSYPFASESYWVSKDTGDLALTDACSNRGVLHPLLHHNISDLDSVRFSAQYKRVPRMIKQVYYNRELLLGVTFVELAYAGIQQLFGKNHEHVPLVLKDLVWAQPIFLSDEMLEYGLELFQECDGSTGFEIYTPLDEPKGRRLVLAQGTAGLSDAPCVSGHALISHKDCPSENDPFILSGRDWYEARSAAQWNNHSDVEIIQRISTSKEAVWVKVSLSDPLIGEGVPCLVHPVLLHEILQATAILEQPDYVIAAKQFVVPVRVKAIGFLKKIPEQAWVRIRPNSIDENGSLREFNIDLLDEEYNLCMFFKGMSVTALTYEWGASQK